MSKVHVRSKRGKRLARNAPKPGTTATDRRLLAQAKREDESCGDFRGEYVRGQLVKACDQLGGAIALAQQAGELETVEAMTPVLATLWSTRMELGETVGGAT